MKLLRLYIYLGLLFGVHRSSPTPPNLSDQNRDKIIITPEQDKFIDNLANYYSRLTLSFHPQEIPFDEYYKKHSSDVDEFAAIMKEIRSSLMTSDVLKNLNDLERDSIFFEKVSQYHHTKMTSDTKPDTFEVIKAWYHHNIRPKSEDVKNFCAAFERNKQISKNSIIEALSKFSNKHVFNENREKYFGDLDRKDYLPEKKNDPDLSIHHIIPLSLLKKFFQRYYEIEEKKEETLMMNHEYNWYKIMSHNQRILLINTLKHHHLDYHEYLNELINRKSNSADPSTSEKKLLKNAKNPKQQLQEDSDYSEFMDMMLSLPPGLSFRGPTDRSDDPGGKFEQKCVIILGQEYFDKVKVLHDQIKKFVEDQSYDEEDAIRIFNRILSIHLEQGAQIIFEYNPIHWTLKNGKWQIKSVDEWNILQSQEWFEKYLAQNQNRARILTISSDGRATALDDFLFLYHVDRKKRSVVLQNNDSLEMLKNKCNEPPKLPERHFCYSAPYYMLFPPIYVYCRLFYYR